MFQAVYGFPSPHFTEVIEVETPLIQLEEFLEEGQEMSQVIRQHLLESQNRMKQFIEMKRSEREVPGTRSDAPQATAIQAGFG